MIDDRFRIYARTTFEGSGYRWITIPNGIELRGDETFDPVLVQQLYDVGYQKERTGPKWNTRPPAVFDNATVLR